MRSKFFRSAKEKDLKEKDVRVILPEEAFTLIQYHEQGLPCIAMVNSALLGFDHKELFRWHLSVIIDFDEVIDKGMPSEEEREIVDPFCAQLEEKIKAGGNALFLIRETWNKTRRLVWMVYDPEIAHQQLQHIIEHHIHPRPFDYRMEDDREWKQPDWYFSALEA
ncbi:MAG: DUF695 domain-containing protein [Pseudomonadota bacterium]